MPHKCNLPFDYHSDTVPPWEYHPRSTSRGHWPCGCQRPWWKISPRPTSLLRLLVVSKQNKLDLITKTQQDLKSYHQWAAHCRDNIRWLGREATKNQHEFGASSRPEHCTHSHRGRHRSSRPRFVRSARSKVAPVQRPPRECCESALDTSCPHREQQQSGPGTTVAKWESCSDCNVASWSCPARRASNKLDGWAAAGKNVRRQWSPKWPPRSEHRAAIEAIKTKGDN